jgi:hypothetical protein
LVHPTRIRLARRSCAQAGLVGALARRSCAQAGPATAQQRLRNQTDMRTQVAMTFSLGLASRSCTDCWARLTSASPSSSSRTRSCHDFFTCDSENQEPSALAHAYRMGQRRTLSLETACRVAVRVMDRSEISVNMSYTPP